MPFSHLPDELLFVLQNPAQRSAAMGCMFLPYQNTLCNLLPPGDVLGGGGFGRQLGHKGGGLLIEIGAFRKEIPESSTALSPSEDICAQVALTLLLEV